MKCIWKDCEKEAEYIYLGKSLCEEHFEKLKLKEEKKIKKLRLDEIQERL